ncbi:lipocalin family protein [Mycolicibacterium parafortuitum]|uniref:Putative lipocalin [Nocardia brasiliensis ATCC] n=1 Tax=Mycolicibacterium parafortuitum TaxID=39692 RepID=A0A375YF06_MYCPF|nr:lipocalin family protein [Mycolicibacterium parafortuitum]ORB31538.1 lipocalin [Mycolicibacterium parafortuitum]SRX79693.1 putative lipocalin [Nocardia brasiliensis ATCC] [Mycolicibacterium parafortuitum]
MTSQRWAIWLGAFGAGACIALGAGQGAAAADTDTGDSADTSSQTTRSDTAAAIATKPAAAGTSAPTGRDDQADQDTPAAESEEAGSSSDIAVKPRHGTRRHDADTDSDPDTGADSDLDSATAEGVAEETADPPAAERDTHAKPAAVRDDDTAEAAPAETAAVRTPDQAAPVTGVKTGHSRLDIPLGDNGYRTRADWYLPTQADGTVAATGVIWLQHGFLGNKAFVSALAKNISQQTNSIVVAPNLSSFPLACSACWINGAPLQEAVASMFLDNRASLTASALAAGYLGALPDDFVLSGQSAGGGFATAVGGYYATDPTSDDSLRGVVMFDGFAFNGVLAAGLKKLDDPFVPVYQIAAPAQSWNGNGASTAELVAARPGRFVGVTLAGGSHSDSLIGSGPLTDLLLQLVTGFSPAGNTAAAYTLATGWINDMYRGPGPADGAGIYGAPDQYIVMGDASAVVLAPPPAVDLARYLGTWFEVGSVKQFFSIGLVNTKAVYSLNTDGSIKVENSGNYFFNNGPQSSIVGAALPVDPADNKLNVRFFGPPSATPPGNYWIVDLDPDYRWAVVTDSTGLSGFLLTRDPIVSPDFYRELLARASVNGVKGRITPTRQPAAAADATSGAV